MGEGYYYTEVALLTTAAVATVLAVGFTIFENLTSTTTVSTRATPGADGATSQILKTKSDVTGKTLKVDHRVTSKEGEVIHEHTKYRKFLPF